MGGPLSLCLYIQKLHQRLSPRPFKQRSVVVHFLCGQASYSPSKTVTLLNVASPTPLWKKLISVELAYQDLHIVSC